MQDGISLNLEFIAPLKLPRLSPWSIPSLELIYSRVLIGSRLPAQILRRRWQPTREFVALEPWRSRMLMSGLTAILVKLWSTAGRAQLEELPLAVWASRRSKVLPELLDRMNPTIGELTRAVEQEARKRPEVQRQITRTDFAAVGTWDVLLDCAAVAGTQA
jgi:hypothetical protein